MTNPPQSTSMLPSNLNTEEVKAIFNGNEKEIGLFLNIVNLKKQGQNIAFWDDRMFLTDLFQRILSHDDTQLLHLFLKLQITPFDAGLKSTYTDWFLQQTNPKLLRVFFEHNTYLNLNTKIRSLDNYFVNPPTTILQAAAKWSTLETIEFLLDDADRRNISYDKNNIIEHAIYNKNADMPILEKILLKGFSPYTIDNVEYGIGGFFDLHNNLIYSRLYNVASQDNEHYKILINNMNDIPKLKQERELFLAVLNVGHSTATANNPNKDSECLFLLNHKLEALTEKKMLEQEIKKNEAATKPNLTIKI